MRYLNLEKHHILAIAEFIRHGRKLEAIRELLTATDLSLKDRKEYIERWLPQDLLKISKYYRTYCEMRADEFLRDHGHKSNESDNESDWRDVLAKTARIIIKTEDYERVRTLLRNHRIEYYAC